MIRTYDNFADIIGSPLYYNPNYFTFYYDNPTGNPPLLISKIPTRGRNGRNGGNGEDGSSGSNGSSGKNGKGMDNRSSTYDDPTFNFVAPVTGTYRVSYSAIIEFTVPPVIPPLIPLLSTSNYTMVLNIVDNLNISTPINNTYSYAGGYSNLTDCAVISQNEIYLEAGNQITMSTLASDNTASLKSVRIDIVWLE